ncbi:hypothetical protein PIB30_039620 [Stylosanthes scabra]|uniref:Uncharacterized protein n=1 Tax=Stylosanthes scabra TaxID=79078 RepID=A0ABU6QEG3_9FABA|nr:hypothetical protein [Stylosanthes scabra]
MVPAKGKAAATVAGTTEREREREIDTKIERCQRGRKSRRRLHRRPPWPPSSSTTATSSSHVDVGLEEIDATEKKEGSIAAATSSCCCSWSHLRHHRRFENSSPLVELTVAAVGFCMAEEPERERECELSHCQVVAATPGCAVAPLDAENGMFSPKSVVGKRFLVLGFVLSIF